MKEEVLFSIFSGWYELCILNGIEPERIVERMGGMRLITLDNILAGEKNNTEDTLGYSEGNWEDYEAFKKKREESLRIPNE